MLKLSSASRSVAGAYQQERFEEGRRAWRRRVLPTVRCALFPAIAVCLGYEIVRPSTLHFMAGFCVGGLACIYLWARDAVPAHIQRHADGADGERRTERVLKPLLADGWRVAHDIDTGRGNRDHVLVGPGGVFLLDSKWLGGVVTIEGDTLCVERVDDQRDSYELPKLAAIERAEAWKLHNEIAQAASVRTWVTAVVVVWARFDARIVEGDRIFFVHGEELAGWLRQRPHRTSDATIERIAEHIGRSAGNEHEPAGSHPDPVPL
jgi:hypothetical protein